jgi:hypothetical protein
MTEARASYERALVGRSRNGGFWNGGCVNCAEMEFHCRFPTPPNDYQVSKLFHVDSRREL